MESNSLKIEIISEPSEKKPYVVISKPSGLASAPICPNDKKNALFQAIELYPELKSVKGKKQIEYGLLHRIDTQTTGLILIAATQEFYDYMQLQQQNEKFIKYYRAICDIIPDNCKKLAGFPKENAINNKFFEKNNFIKKTDSEYIHNVKSYFRFFGEKNREVRPVTLNCGKAALKKIGKPVEYETQISIKEIYENQTEVECRITRGFRHQVRCHLAWIGFPIQNDILYNSKIITEINSDKKNAVNQKSFKPLRFTAFKIEFFYPEGDLNSYEVTH